MAQPSQANQAARRVVRTAIQAIAGLSATVVIHLLAPHVNPAYLPLIASVLTIVIGAAQNYCEQAGLIPILLPNSHPPAQPVTPTVETPK